VAHRVHRHAPERLLKASSGGLVTRRWRESPSLSLTNSGRLTFFSPAVTRRTCRAPKSWRAGGPFRMKVSTMLGSVLTTFQCSSV